MFQKHHKRPVKDEKLDMQNFRLDSIDKKLI